jgi:hypothetical protein
VVFEKTQIPNRQPAPKPMRTTGCIARRLGRIDGRYIGKSGKTAYCAVTLTGTNKLAKTNSATADISRRDHKSLSSLSNLAISNVL